MESPTVTLSGRAVSRSEMLGYPDTPFSFGSVIAIQADRAEELWPLIGMLPPTRLKLSCVQFHIERPALENVAAVTASINLDGTFDLPLSAGPYLFFLSDVLGQPSVGGMDVVGCAHGVVEDEPAFVSLSYGEEGVQVLGAP